MSAQGITVIILTKGLVGLLQRCLEHLDRALAAAGPLPGSAVVVVDNATDVPILEEDLPGRPVNLIRFDLPKSFAAANNAAARRHPNAYYLLLNNDVLLAGSAVGEMRRLLNETPNAGICGARLVFPDGSIQHDGVVFGPGKAGPYHMARGKPAAQVGRLDGEVQAVTGACMLVCAEVWNALGGLCEDYAFGLEDIDFCLRARQAGWRVVCSRQSDSLHFESMTPGRVQLDISSRRTFMNKWRGRYAIDG